MSAKVIIVHKVNDCISCAACAAVCPKYFEMADDGKSKLKGGKKDGVAFTLVVDDEASAQAAADVCPVAIISVKKEG